MILFVMQLLLLLHFTVRVISNINIIRIIIIILIDTLYPNALAGTRVHLYALVLSNTLSTIHVERGRSVVECRTRNQVSPGSNPLCYRFEDWAVSFSP